MAYDPQQSTSSKLPLVLGLVALLGIVGYFIYAGGATVSTAPGGDAPAADTGTPAPDAVIVDPAPAEGAAPADGATPPAPAP